MNIKTIVVAALAAVAVVAALNRVSVGRKVLGS